MIDVTFKINTVDYSSLLSTFTVTHEVEYPKTMTAIDGTEYGYARRRPVIKFSLIPLTDAQCTTLYGYLQSGEVTVEYTDPHRYSTQNPTKTSVMRLMTSIESIFGLKSVDGNRYYKGTEITLRQRTVL